MSRTENNLTCCMLTNRLEAECYQGWTEAELATLPVAKAGNIAPYVEVISNRLYRAGLYTAALYGILHDKDRRRILDEKTNGYKTIDETIHVHIDVAFVTKETADASGKVKKRSASNSTVENICAAVGFANAADVQKPERGRYAWDNMLSYLTHIKYNDSEKHHYAAENVVNFIANDKNGKPMARTYQQIYESNKTQWMKARGKIVKQQAKADIDEVVVNILSGKISMDMIMEDDALFNVYSFNQKRCNEAFSAYQRRKAYFMAEALFNDEMKLSVFYVTGEPGQGKTYFTTEAARAIEDWSVKNGYRRWSTYDAGDKNGMDGYSGEEILIFDDVTAYTMTAGEWEKILNPRKVSQASARYNNKMVTANVIFIVSKFHPVEFFSKLREKDESMEQFLRRMEGVVRVLNLEEMEYRTIIEKQVAEPQMYLRQDGIHDNYLSRFILDEMVWVYTAENMKRKLINIIENNNLPVVRRFPEPPTEDEFQADVLGLPLGGGGQGGA